MAADWSHLLGRTFYTIQGAPFTVVNVTKKSIIIQPASGRCRYDISIADELERTLEAYAEGRFFPKPTDLLYLGVRHERNSYVWGIARTLAVEDARTRGAATDSLGGLIKVDSTLVYALGYDESQQALEVVFWSGQIWRYESVTREEYDTLMKGPSIGGYLRELMETHPGRRLRHS